MDPTKKLVKKNNTHRKTKKTRVLVKMVEVESFFNVFANREMPKGTEEIESDDENDMQDKMEQAMNLAEDLHEVLIPDALEYYLGVNQEVMELNHEDENIAHIIKRGNTYKRMMTGVGADDDDDEDGKEDLT